MRLKNVLNVYKIILLYNNINIIKLVMFEDVEIVNVDKDLI